MALLDLRGGYLYQTNPALFPEGQLTGTEVLLWEWYYRDKAANMKRK